MSVMEMSHRGKEFSSIIAQAEADLRALLGIPDNYQVCRGAARATAPIDPRCRQSRRKGAPFPSLVQVLFLQGGATSQFSAVPLNLAGPDDTADYIVTGSWSKKAAEEARKYANVNVAAKGDNRSVPAKSEWSLTPGAKYVHYCDNETINGVEFKGVPEVRAAVFMS